MRMSSGSLSDGQSRPPSNGSLNGPLPYSPLDKGRFEKIYPQFCLRYPEIRCNAEITHIDGQAIDLHKLHVEVNHEGGFDEVEDRIAWPIIAARLGFADAPGTDSEPMEPSPEVAVRVAICYQECLGLFDTQLYQMLEYRRKGMLNALATQNGTDDDNAARASSLGGIPIAAFMRILDTMPLRPVRVQEVRGLIDKWRIDLLNKGVLHIEKKEVPVNLQGRLAQLVQQTFRIAQLMNERLPRFFLVVRQVSVTVDLISVLMVVHRQYELLLNNQQCFIMDDNDFSITLRRMKDCANAAINTGHVLYQRYQQLMQVTAASDGQGPDSVQQPTTSTATVVDSSAESPVPQVARMTALHTAVSCINHPSARLEPASEAGLPLKPSVLTSLPPFQFS